MRDKVEGALEALVWIRSRLKEAEKEEVLNEVETAINAILNEVATVFRRRIADLI